MGYLHWRLSTCSKVVERDSLNNTLGFSDIQHYQKIILALTETDRLMKEVDEVGDK